MKQHERPGLAILAVAQLLSKSAAQIESYAPISGIEKQAAQVA